MEQTKKHCKQCNKIIEKPRATQKFCSRQCQNKGQTLKRESKCPICSKTFILKRKSQKYCSKACTVKNWSKSGTEGAKKSYTFEKRSEASKKAWSKNKEERIKKVYTDEYRYEIGRSTMKRFKDPEFVEKHRKACEASKTDELKARLSLAAIDRFKKEKEELILKYSLINFNDYEIKEITDRDSVFKFLWKYHYIKSKRLPIVKSYGLYLNDSLMGVCVFGHSASVGATNILNGKGLELIRFCLVNNLKKNTASFFMSKCLKLLNKDKPELSGVISFADTSIHLGTIYKATNWEGVGTSKGSYCYKTKTGDIISRHAVYRHCNSLRLLEREYVEKVGLTRIDSAKKLKFVYRFEK